MVYAKKLMDGAKYSHDDCMKTSWSYDATVDFWLARAEKLNQDDEGRQLTPAAAKVFWAKRRALAKQNGKKKRQ